MEGNSGLTPILNIVFSELLYSFLIFLKYGIYVSAVTSVNDPVPDIIMSPPEVIVPENVGDALVANPKLVASVKSPKVNQPLLAEFLIFNKLFGNLD